MQDRFFHRFPGAGALGAALALTSVLAAFPAAATTEDHHLALSYEVYVGGLPTVNLSYDALLKAGTYDMKMALKGRGVLDWWFSWTVKAFSEGRLRNGSVVPIRAGADSSWSGKDRQTRITYVSNGLPKVEISPRPKDDGDRPVVPAALRKGAPDLSSAVLAALSRVAATNRCDAREAVFDGRRRYDLVLKHLGTDDLAANAYSPFSGPALRCRLSIDRIAGYRPDEKRSSWRSSNDATIWLGRPFKAALPVPVRMEMETRVGALRAYLTDAAATADGKRRSLEAVP